MTTMKVSAAERRRLVEERREVQEQRKAVAEYRKAEKKRAKAVEAQLVALNAARLERAKRNHESLTAQLYTDHVSRTARGTAARLKTLAGGMVAFLGNAGAVATTDAVRAENTKSLEALLAQAGVDPAASFKAPEFVAPKPVEQNPVYTLGAARQDIMRHFFDSIAYHRSLFMAMDLGVGDVVRIKRPNGGEETATIRKEA